MADLGRLRALLVGFYAWVCTLTFGATLLDVVYGRLLEDIPGLPDPSAVFAEVSDFLLCLGGVLIVAGMGAIIACWRSATARNLLVASLLCASFEFWGAFLVAIFLRDAGGLATGPWLRLIPMGGASVLAMLGVEAYCRRSQAVQ